MFGMCERLKLANLLCIQAGKGFFGHGFLQNAREKLRLGAIIFRFQPSLLADFLDGGKIDVRGQILFADIRQQIVADMMAMIRAQCSVKSRG